MAEWLPAPRSTRFLKLKIHGTRRQTLESVRNSALENNLPRTFHPTSTREVPDSAGRGHSTNMLLRHRRARVTPYSLDNHAAGSPCSGRDVRCSMFSDARIISCSAPLPAEASTAGLEEARFITNVIDRIVQHRDWTCIHYIALSAQISFTFAEGPLRRP